MAMPMLKLEDEIPSPPAITTPPHPRDVAQRLELRQLTQQTCGWVNAQSSLGITCPIGSVCAQNTAYNAAFCCEANLYPYCGIVPTTCLNSAEIATRCTGACLFNAAVIKCQTLGLNYCATKVFRQGSIAGLVTGWDCSSTPATYTAFDYYTAGGTTYTNGAAPASQASISVSNLANPVGTPAAFGTPAASSSVSSNSDNGSSSSSSTSTTSSKKGSALSGGAIAGIVIGALAALLIALAMFFLFRYMRKRQDHRQRLSQPQPQPPPPGPQMAAVPPPPSTTTYGAPTTGPSSVPSSQHPLYPPSSGTPLTQQSLSQQNAAMSEVTPADSASQIGGFYGSNVSHNVQEQHQHPHYPSGAGSAGTGPHSGLGPLPEFQNQNPGLYGRHGPESSVMSPGTAFESMPGVRPPDVAPPTSPHSPPPPQAQAAAAGAGAGAGVAAYNYTSQSPPPQQQHQQQQQTTTHLYQQYQQQPYPPPSSPPPPQQQGYAQPHTSGSPAGQAPMYPAPQQQQYPQQYAQQPQQQQYAQQPQQQQYGASPQGGRAEMGG